MEARIANCCFVCRSEIMNIQIQTPNVGISFGMYLLICWVSLTPHNSLWRGLNVRCWKVRQRARSDPRAQCFQREEQIKFTLQPSALRICRSCKPALAVVPTRLPNRNQKYFSTYFSWKCQEMQFCQMTALALNFSDKPKRGERVYSGF